MSVYLREGYIGTKFRPIPARTISERAACPVRASVIDKTFSDWAAIVATKSVRCKAWKLVWVIGRPLPQWVGVQ